MLFHILKSEEMLGKIDHESQSIRDLTSANLDISNKYAINFISDLLTRMHHLTLITVKMIREGHWLPAAMTARGFVETLGLLSLFLDKYDAQKPRDKRKTILERFIFSTRRFAEQKSGVHINDGLRNLEKYAPDISNIYEFLCEAVHPNWLGVRHFAQIGEGIEGADPDDAKEIILICQALLCFDHITDKLHFFEQHMKEFQRSGTGSPH